MWPQQVSSLYNFLPVRDMTPRKRLSWHQETKGHWIKKAWILISNDFGERTWSKGVMWKFIRGNLTKVELGGQKGETCHSISIPGRLSITDPKRKRCTFHLLQQICYSSYWANEKPSSFWTLVFLQGTIIQNNPPNVLLLHKIMFLSVGFPCGFTTTCMPQIVVLCWFLNKPIFVGKITV